MSFLFQWLTLLCREAWKMIFYSSHVLAESLKIFVFNFLCMQKTINNFFINFSTNFSNSRILWSFCQFFYCMNVWAEWASSSFHFFLWLVLNELPEVDAPYALISNFLVQLKNISSNQHLILQIQQLQPWTKYLD